MLTVLFLSADGPLMLGLADQGRVSPRLDSGTHSAEPPSTLNYQEPVTLSRKPHHGSVDSILEKSHRAKPHYDSVDSILNHIDQEIEKMTDQVRVMLLHL